MSQKLDRNEPKREGQAGGRDLTFISILTFISKQGGVWDPGSTILMTVILVSPDQLHKDPANRGKGIARILFLGSPNISARKEISVECLLPPYPNGRNQRNNK